MKQILLPSTNSSAKSRVSIKLYNATTALVLYWVSVLKEITMRTNLTCSARAYTRSNSGVKSLIIYYAKNNYWRNYYSAYMERYDRKNFVEIIILFTMFLVKLGLYWHCSIYYYKYSKFRNLHWENIVVKITLKLYFPLQCFYIILKLLLSQK